MLPYTELRRVHISDANAIDADARAIKTSVNVTWRRRKIKENFLLLAHISTTFQMRMEVTQTQIETVQTTIMSGWNKRQISNWSSAGYLKRVQFYNWFRLHQILYQL